MNKNIAAIACLLLTAAAAPAPAADIAQLARDSGVAGGIVVHLHCGDGADTASLRLDERFRVHALETDAARVAAARKRLVDAGVYGPVSVYRYDGRHLPYTDDFVNLIVGTAGEVSEAELLRVLAPGGVALVDGKRIVKPREGIDDWNHFLHGPDNNAVADDRKVGEPRSFQWVSEPRWARSHEELASISAVAVAGGRVFYIADEAPLASIRFPGEWKLVARDGFNGTLLWKEPIGTWVDVLRHFRSGPAHLPRRLVAVGETVYATKGLAGPVVALDAATGKTRRTYEGTRRTEEILVDDGVLYLAVGTSEVRRRGGGLHERGEPKPSDFRYITAVRAESGSPLWRKDFGDDESLLPLSLTVREGKVFYQSTTGVHCVDAATGEPVWHTPRKTPWRRMGFSAPTVVAAEGVLLVADRNTADNEQNRPSTGKIEWAVHGWNEKGFARNAPCTLTAYDAGTGKELWSTGCRENYNSAVDVFVIDGVVWVGPGWRGLDPRTGEHVRKMDAKAPRVGMTHHRCYRNKATERFILTGKSGIEVLSLETLRWLSNNSWVRGTCQYGIIPANGLLYAPPDACGCFLTVKSPGFFAVAPRRNPGQAMPKPDKPVLAKGPAFGQAAKERTGEADWPMYRRDATRSGVASSALPGKLSPRWSAKIGGKLTQPVIAGGRMFVASVDTHTLVALDADSGERLWRHTAGGRIDSAPTVHAGTVLFGSADGWVTCLHAGDGRVCWRFRAAPAERLVSAYGQLESAWPVHGAVLVQNGIAYAAAGRSSYMDGGIVLYGLDPATGEQLSRTVLTHRDPETGKQVTKEGGFNMVGTTSDILSGDGENVYMKYFAFDRSGEPTRTDATHLYAITGLLGEDWFIRSYWLIGTGQPGAGWGGWANHANLFPSGRILSFTGEEVYGYGRKKVAGGATGHRADAYHLFRMDRNPPKPDAGEKAPARTGRKGRRRRRPRKGKMVWSRPAAPIGRALVVGAERLAVAGPVPWAEKSKGELAFEDPAAAIAGFRGAKGNLLEVVSAEDGKPICQAELPAMPSFDGMSAAGGRLYVSLRNGEVVCYGQ